MSFNILAQFLYPIHQPFTPIREIIKYNISSQQFQPELCHRKALCHSIGVIIPVSMSCDSQELDYMQVLHDAITNRQKVREWKEGPQISYLTSSAIFRVLLQHQQTQQQQSAFIQQQSLKLNELEIRIGGKASKKDIQEEVGKLHKNKVDLSQYEQLLKQDPVGSLSEVDVEEVKTITQLATQNRLNQMKLEWEKQLLAERHEQQERIARLKDQIKNQLLENEKEHRDLQRQLGQSQKMSQMTEVRGKQAGDEAMLLLEERQKQLNEHLSQILSQLQQNYPTKKELTQALNLIQSPQPKRDKSCTTIQQSKSQNLATTDLKKHLNQQIDTLRITTSKEIAGLTKQFHDFRQKNSRQLKNTLTNETMRSILEQSQQQLFEKFHKEVAAFEKKSESNWSRAEQRMDELAQQSFKQIENFKVRSERRPKKQVSPSKTADRISQAISRIESKIEQSEQKHLRELEKAVQSRIEVYDRDLIYRLETRERKLCQVVEEVCQEKTQRTHPSYERVKSKQSKREWGLVSCYLFRGTHQVNREGMIPWETERLNAIVDNVNRNQDKTLLTVKASGLYRVEMGVYCSAFKGESQLLINQHLVVTVPKPVGARLRGGFFSETLLLNANSSIGVRVSDDFHGQAYLMIQML